MVRPTYRSVAVDEATWWALDVIGRFRGQCREALIADIVADWVAFSATNRLADALEGLWPGEPQILTGDEGAQE